MAALSPSMPQERSSRSASVGRRPGSVIRFAPVIGWPDGFSSTRGVSRELTRIFEGAAAASARSRSLSSSRMASVGMRLAI